MQRISPYVKMMVLAAVDIADGVSLRQRFLNASKRVYYDENNVALQFTWKTIDAWYWRYKKYGATELAHKTRRDKGTPRKVRPEQLAEAIDSVQHLFRKNPREAGPHKPLSPKLVYKACIEKGILRREDVSQTSFYRVTKAFELFKSDEEAYNKKRLAFSKAHSNELWQGDTLYGPVVRIKGSAVQTKLIAFIDDASRVIPHGQFFAAENVETLIATLRQAIYKRGVPQQIYVDNGAIYASKEMSLVCSRLGILLSHAPVRDGAAKGKIERFFRTVRECFLSGCLNLDSLENLNRQFIDWLESQYNAKIHSSIGLKPIDRFGVDLKRIRFLPPDPHNDELFFLEVERAVSKTNTFQLHNILFEVPVDLRSKTIAVRFDRLNFKKNHVVVYFKNQRVGVATALDLISNDRQRQRDARTP